MIVTDLKYGLENKLIEKLDLMIARCTNKVTRKDAMIIVEGAEGEGKTNSSEAIAYYVKSKTGFPIHMFFSLANLIEHAKNTEGQVIIWDEPAIDSLSIDWYNQVNKDLLRLLMTCRKKRHFIIINMVKFYKFSEYVVVDRCLGMIHMYSRRERVPGRFIYIKRRSLEYLFNNYKREKKRDYKKFTLFSGSFPIVEDKLGQMGITIEGVPNCTLEMYEKLKDKAIASIGKKKKELDKYYLETLKLKSMIVNFDGHSNTQKEFLEKIGLAKTTMHDWRKKLQTYQELNQNDTNLSTMPKIPRRTGFIGTTPILLDGEGISDIKPTQPVNEHLSIINSALEKERKVV